MKNEVIKKVFSENSIKDVTSIKKIEVGFSNDVYSVDDKYILKVCKSEENEYRFKRESHFYKFFHKKIPVPNVIIFDDTKKVIDKLYTIYHKIEGDNLYSQWHLMDERTRRDIFRQLCGLLRVINEADYTGFKEILNFDDPFSWHDKVYNRVAELLSETEVGGVISKEFIESIKGYVETNHGALEEQKIGLVYWDAHFDNILVKENKIVGILDFERTDVDSIDFGLDIIKRMVEQPSKYISEEFEKHVKREDYENLLDWFKEFYPKPFEFKNLETRLDLYSIQHDLDTLRHWPDAKALRSSLADTVGFTQR
ncbi:MAG: aminoglycoside phosphotransferase family protein [Parcubacteria group bacterium]|nr:aminoglycoside phosphotransferase family protein [Parcubacteria group bacterium]